MPTEIDSLQIRIESQSSSAVKNIDALIASLNNLKSTSGLTRLGNGLKTLSESLAQFETNSAGMKNLSSLAQALKPLQSIKLSGFTSAINGLKKIPDITKSLDASTIEAFATSCNKLSTALSPLATQMERVGSTFTAMPSAVKKTANSVEAYSASAATAEKTTAGFFASISDLHMKLIGISYVTHLVGNTLGQWITNINTYVENVNLFTVSMGKYADEAMAYAERVSDLMGIDVSEWIRNQGVFMSIATGFGLVEDKAYELSKGLTELSYDISSFFNISLDAADSGAFAKVRSGLAGELEPLRALGYALDEATLQQVAYDHGIQMSIETMTQAQKAMLRYTAIVEQSARMGVIGDLSRTLITPANAIRILQQQIQQLTRALGSLFIPILIKVIPYVQAFTQILTSAIQKLATLVGFELPTIDYSSLDKVATSVEDTSEGLEEATENAKKLKSYMLGIDELNVIDPTSGSSSTGAGASVYGDDLGLDIGNVWDESMLSSIQSEVDEIVEKMKPMLELAVGIGAAILAWKVSSKFITGLNQVKTALGIISGSTAASSAGTFFFGAKFTEKFMKFASFLKNFKIGSLILGTGSTSLGAALAAVVAVAGAIAALGYGIYDVYKKSENFRNGLSAILNGLKTVFGWAVDGISWLGEQIGKIQLPEGLQIAIDGFSDAFSWAELSIGDFLIAAGGLALFGPWGLAIEGAVLAVKFLGNAVSDSLEPVDLFGEGISELTKNKVEPFLEKMDELETTLNTLNWGKVEIEFSDVETIRAKLNEITTVIIDELDADKNAALAKLDPLKGALDNTELTYDELVGKIEQSYAQQEGIVLSYKNKITAIYQNAANENRAITDEEAAEIAALQEKMKTTGIKYLSESETESNLILQRLKDSAGQLTAEQAAEQIRNAISARDKTIKAAEEQYKGIELEAQRMLDTGTISKEEYDAIIAAAKTTRDDTIDAANEQYDSIVETAKSKMGEYAKYIDTETGEIKSNWQVFCDDVEKGWKLATAVLKPVAEAAWKATKKWFGDNVKPWFTKEKWEGIFSGIKDGLESGIKKALNKGIELLNQFIGWVNDKMSFTIPGFEIGEMEIKNPFTGETKKWGGVELWGDTDVTLFTLPTITQKFADGGFIEDGLFTMNHGEIAGKFNNGKSVVANNEQIIAGISEGVYSAVVAAMQNAGGNSGEQIIAGISEGVYSAVVAAMQNAGGNSGEQNVNVYLDGKQIYAAVKKTESERGKQLFGNQLGYGY